LLVLGPYILPVMSRSFTTWSNLYYYVLQGPKAESQRPTCVTLSDENSILHYPNSRHYGCPNRKYGIPELHYSSVLSGTTRNRCTLC